jgi:hypothetical protein
LDKCVPHTFIKWFTLCIVKKMVQNECIMEKSHLLISQCISMTYGIASLHQKLKSPIFWDTMLCSLL